MRDRLIALAWLVVLSGVGWITLSLTHGQDAPPRPPVIKKAPSKLVISTPSPTPEKKPARDLSQMTQLQKEMFLTARRAAGWADRMNGVKGRFDYGLEPALNIALQGDHPLKQAGAAFALARAARHLDDEGHAARARQAVLALLENTVTDKKQKVRHSVLPSAVLNRLSYAALLVLTIHELPEPDADLLAKSDQLCAFLREQQRPDGSLRCREPLAGGRQEDEREEVLLYPGQALYALMRSQEHRPAEWKTDLVRKATPFYLKWWRDHKNREFVAWHTAAWGEAYLATGDKTLSEAVFELNDWLCGLQHDQLDPRHPQWLGGFQNFLDGKGQTSAPDITSAVCGEALAEACRVSRKAGDVGRHKRYMTALERVLQFLTTLQYTEADTQHFADWYRPRLVGGFHFSHQDGNLRIDHTQHALCALVQYLKLSVDSE